MKLSLCSPTFLPSLISIVSSEVPPINCWCVSHCIDLSTVVYSRVQAVFIDSFCFFLRWSWREFVVFSFLETNFHDEKLLWSLCCFISVISVFYIYFYTNLWFTHYVRLVFLVYNSRWNIDGRYRCTDVLEMNKWSFVVFIITGSIMFHVRRRPADYMPRKRKKKPAGKWNELDHRYLVWRMKEEIVVKNSTHSFYSISKYVRNIYLLFNKTIQMICIV